MLESASVEEDVMTPLERSISERALIFAKANRTRIARELACLANYPGENYPVSVFMKATVCRLKREFLGSLQVDVLIKDTDAGESQVGIDLSADEIDELVRQPYHPDQLEQILIGVAL